MSESNRSISVRITVKKNLGNYENIEFSASLTELVGSHEDLHSQEIWDSCWAEVDKQIETKLLELTPE